MVADKLHWVFAMLACFVFHDVHGQDYLHKEVYLKVGSVRLDSVLLIVTRQTGVVFSYNAKKIDTHQRIKVGAATKNLGHVLDMLKKEKGFSIKTIENYVVISLPDPLHHVGDIPKSPNPLRDPTTAKKSTASKQNLVIDQGLPEKKNEPVASSSEKESPAFEEMNVKPVHEQWRSERAKASQRNTRPEVKGHIVLPVFTLPKPTRKDTVRRGETTHVPRTKNRLFLKQGLTVDESSFMGVSFQAGWPIAYATLSGNSNLLVSHLRYGFGSSVKLNSGLRLHIKLNNGSLHRSGHYTDSLGKRFPLAVKSELMRIGLGLEWSLKNRLTLQVTPIFNWLATRYFINGASSDLRIFGNQGDQLFYTIHAPYAFTNTFSPTSSTNTKSWMGLQLDLLYRINF
jgi:hypothetical protein